MEDSAHHFQAGSPEIPDLSTIPKVHSCSDLITWKRHMKFQSIARVLRAYYILITYSCIFLPQNFRTYVDLKRSTNSDSASCMYLVGYRLVCVNYVFMYNVCPGIFFWLLYCNRHTITLERTIHTSYTDKTW